MSLCGLVDPCCVTGPQTGSGYGLPNDPDFLAKAAQIVERYLDPPENAIVLAFDEKPHICQALERAQGFLKMSSGRAAPAFDEAWR